MLLYFLNSVYSNVVCHVGYIVRCAAQIHRRCFFCKHIQNKSKFIKTSNEKKTSVYVIRCVFFFLVSPSSRFWWRISRCDIIWSICDQFDIPKFDIIYYHWNDYWFFVVLDVAISIIYSSIHFLAFMSNVVTFKTRKQKLLLPLNLVCVYSINV